MSNFTHKLVVFSEDYYRGDALILMGSPDTYLGVEVDVKKCRYYQLEDDICKEKNFEFPHELSSYIVVRGQWELTVDYVRSYVNAGTALNFFPRYINAVRSVSKIDELEKKELPGLVTSRSVDAPSCVYRITFLPLNDAFVISPAPSFLCDEANEFRWDLRHGDQLIYFWDEKQVFGNPRLEFFGKNGSTNRSSFLVDELGKTIDGSNIQRGVAYTVSVVRENASWAFDFVCSYKSALGNVHEYRVDPEVVLSTGSSD